LTVDVNKTSGAAFAIDGENAGSTALTFNNNVVLENTNGGGSPSQVIIGQESGATAAGTMTFNGSLAPTSLGAPTIFTPQNGGVININGSYTATGTGSSTYLAVGYTNSAALSGGTVNLNQTNGATAPGINDIMVDSTPGLSNTLNMAQNLTLNGDAGAIWIDYTYGFNYQGGNCNLDLTGNGITVNASTGSLRFGGSATATDTITVGSNFSGGATTNSLPVNNILLGSTVGDSQSYVFYAAANNTLNLGVDNMIGTVTTENVVIAGPGVVEDEGKNTTTVPWSFAPSGGTLEVGGDVVSGGVLTKGPAGTGTFNITNGTIEDNGAAEPVPESITLGGTATLQDATPYIYTGLTFPGATLNTMPTFTLTANSTLIVNNNTQILDPIGDNSKGYSLTLNGTGELTLSGSDTYSGGTTVSGGTLYIATNTALPAGSNVVNNATLQFGATTVAGNISGASGVTVVSGGANLKTAGFSQSGFANYGVLQINGAGSIGQFTGSGSLIIGSGTSDNTVQIAPAATIDGNDNTQASVTISSGSKLDITNNQFNIADPGGAAHDSNFSTILGYVESGAITSTEGTASYGIGVVDGNDGVLGTPVSANTIEVAYTLYGDANLDGKVDITDFNIFAPNFGLPTTLGWEAGDFSYSGVVDIGDFNLFAANFGLQDSGAGLSMPSADYAALDAFAAANGLSLTSNVPEPGSLAMLMFFSATGLLARRYRASNNHHRVHLPSLPARNVTAAAIV
jgi:autotransporter-associated beta strand protein